MAGSWASIADVLEIARKNVSDDDIARAQSTIDVYSNRTIAASGAMGARDRGWLKIAVAWQAAREAATVTDDGRAAYSSLDQDGVRVQHRGQHEQDLHPLAARALKNLSWKGSRSQRVPPGYVPANTALSWSDDEDPRWPWSPM